MIVLSYGLRLVISVWCTYAGNAIYLDAVRFMALVSSFSWCHRVHILVPFIFSSVPMVSSIVQSYMIGLVSMYEIKMRVCNVVICRAFVPTLHVYYFHIPICYKPESGRRRQMWCREDILSAVFEQSFLENIKYNVFTTTHPGCIPWLHYPFRYLCEHQDKWHHYSIWYCYRIYHSIH